MPQRRQKMSNTKIPLKLCSSQGQKETANAFRMLTYLTQSPLLHYKNAWLTGTQDQPLLCCGRTSSVSSADVVRRTMGPLWSFPSCDPSTTFLSHWSKANAVFSMLFSAGNGWSFKVTQCRVPLDPSSQNTCEVLHLSIDTEEVTHGRSFFGPWTQAGHAAMVVWNKTKQKWRYHNSEVSNF